MFLIEEEVLNRIDFLLKYKHWTLYKLAKVSGLPYSSLNNIFNRRTCPTIPTLEKICKGFNITLSQFFEYGTNPLKAEGLTDNEQEILNAYNSLSRRDRDRFEGYLMGLCKK